MSLNDSWDQVPTGLELQAELEQWGIFDSTLSQVALQEWWVRFTGMDFGVIPREFYAQCTHDLFTTESHLVAQQCDIGCISVWEFDPLIDHDYFHMMRPTPVTTEQFVAVT